MPFKSKAQRRYMYARHPELAAEFSAHTPKGASLPEHAKHEAETSALRRLAKKGKK